MIVGLRGEDMLHYEVRHDVRYRLDRAVEHATLQVRMKPAAQMGQLVQHAVLRVAPDPQSHVELKDGFGNEVSHVRLRGRVRCIQLSARSTVTIDVARRTAATDAWRSLAEAFDVNQWRRRVVIATGAEDDVDRRVVQLAAAAASAGGSRQQLYERIVRLVADTLRYDASAAQGAEVGRALITGRGSCKDYAELTARVLRKLDFEVRYLMGFAGIHCATEPEQPRFDLPLHAWVAIASPYGWIAADPTRGDLECHRYIVLASGETLADVAPVRSQLRKKARARRQSTNRLRLLTEPPSMTPDPNLTMSPTITPLHLSTRPSL